MGPRRQAGLTATWWGRARFAPVLAHTLAVRERVAEGEPEELHLVEHPPVLTLGRRGLRQDVLWTDEQLARAGVEVESTPRGGEVTLHAPGQLVAYPIVVVGRQIRAHIERLARVSVALLDEIGVTGGRYDPQHPGVWIGEAKIASIGVHVRRGVTVQGIAVNVDVSPTLFGALVSCGMRDITMISARDVVARVPAMEALARRWATLYAEDAGQALRWRDDPPPSRSP